MSKQQQEFNCYCLDRCKPVSEELPIAYDDGCVITKVRYKIGLRAMIRRRECFVLFTESEDDLNGFTYISADHFYDNQERFFTEVISFEEFKELIKKLPNINIFEFVSLLSFINIYADFKNFVDANWEILNMDNLIEI